MDYADNHEQKDSHEEKKKLEQSEIKGTREMELTEKQIDPTMRKNSRSCPPPE